MKYQNTKTGAIIDVKSEITAGHWRALESANTAKEKIAPVQPRKRKVVKKDE